MQQRQDRLHARIVQADHRQAVERQVVQELDEAVLQAFEIAAVGAEVIVVDVGDDGDHRLQVQERGIALVGLGDEVAAVAEARIAAGALQAAADHEGGIESGLGKQPATRLVVVVLPWLPATAMRVFRKRMSSASISARCTTGMSASRGGQHLRVIVRDRRGDHHHIGIAHPCPVMALINPAAKALQPSGDVALPQVRTLTL